jgi:glutathione S-transferase
MKLYNNRPSPYGRKVLVAAHEKALLDRLDIRQIDPWSDPPELLAVTPIGKVPALVTDDGKLITESTTICEYFDAVGAGLTLIGDDRFAVMARVALAQGLVDAAFGSVIERRRPSEQQWDGWIERQRRTIERTLATIKPVAGRFDLGDITLACALAYLDFRLSEIAWRSAHRALGEWLDQVSCRPSMQVTVP